MERVKPRRFVIGENEEVEGLKTRDVTRVMNQMRQKGQKLRALHQATEDDFAMLSKFLDAIGVPEEVSYQEKMSVGTAILVKARKLQQISKERAEKRKTRRQQLEAIPVSIEVEMFAMPEMRVVEQIGLVG